MRAVRLLMIVAPATLAACGMIAGLDGYELSNLTAGADASNGAQTQDGSTSNQSTGNDGTNSGPEDAGPVIVVDDDAGVVVIDDAGDGSFIRDTGTESDASCTLTANGKSCGSGSSNGADADVCCSNICDEAHLCSSNQCTPNGSSCSNQVQLSCDFHGNCVGNAQGTCCVNQFCNPGDQSVTSGKCSPCIEKGGTPPTREGQFQVFFSRVNAPVTYDDACCSQQVDNNGKCR